METQNETEKKIITLVKANIHHLRFALDLPFFPFYICNCSQCKSCVCFFPFLTILRFFSLNFLLLYVVLSNLFSLISKWIFLDFKFISWWWWWWRCVWDSAYTHTFTLVVLSVFCCVLCSLFSTRWTFSLGLCHSPGQTLACVTTQFVINF